MQTQRIPRWNPSIRNYTSSYYITGADGTYWLHDMQPYGCLHQVDGIWQPTTIPDALQSIWQAYFAS